MYKNNNKIITQWGTVNHIIMNATWTFVYNFHHFLPCLKLFSIPMKIKIIPYIITFILCFHWLHRRLWLLFCCCFSAVPAYNTSGAVGLYEGSKHHAAEQGEAVRRHCVVPLTAAFVSIFQPLLLVHRTTLRHNGLAARRHILDRVRVCNHQSSRRTYTTPHHTVITHKKIK